MNIRDFWDEAIPQSMEIPGAEAWQAILACRASTYRGFAKVEEIHGLVNLDIRLDTAPGQDVLRTMTMRGLEEMLESAGSFDPDHRLEELIDALNFFLNLAVMDKTIDLGRLVQDLSSQFYGFGIVDPLSEPLVWTTEINYALIDALTDMAPMLARLRNRSWQNSPQSTFFDGWPETCNFLSSVCYRLLNFFPSWESFVRYFMAKDRVLQFRIKSQY